MTLLSALLAQCKIVVFLFLFFLVPMQLFAAIEGKITDQFGQEIEGVTVSIENSGFASVSNDEGRYAIDYVPGKIKLTYAKEGFTTQHMELELYTKDTFPAAPVEMWEIPGEGLFFVDRQKRAYIELTQSYQVSGESKLNDKKYYKSFNPNELYAKLNFFANEAGSVSLANGKIEIIDNFPRLLVLYKRGKGNLLLSLRKGIGGIIEGKFFDGQVNEESHRIGDEGLLVRSFAAEDGLYVFAESEEANQMGNKFTYPQGSYFPIGVGDYLVDNQEESLQKSDELPQEVGKEVVGSTARQPQQVKDNGKKFNLPKKSKETMFVNAIQSGLSKGKTGQPYQLQYHGKLLAEVIPLRTYRRDGVLCKNYRVISHETGSGVVINENGDACLMNGRDGVKAKWFPGYMAGGGSSAVSGKQMVQDLIHGSENRETVYASSPSENRSAQRAEKSEPQTLEQTINQTVEGTVNAVFDAIFGQRQ